MPVAPQLDRVRPELIEREVIRAHGLQPGCAELHAGKSTTVTASDVTMAEFFAAGLTQELGRGS